MSFYQAEKNQKMTEQKQKLPVKQKVVSMS